MVNEKEMILDGFKFSSRKEFERALKEKETIEYIVANTNMSDAKAILKVYNKAVDKKSFQTVIGLEFVNNMRKKIISSGVVQEKNLAYVPIVQKYVAVEKKPALNRDEVQREAEKYKKAYEDEAAGRKIRNMAIAFLTLLLAALVIITIRSKYSVFTYFTDYKSNMENELIDKYEKWEQTLEDRQKAIDKKEKELEDKQKDEAENSK
ncbi:hypothetical protein KQI69_05730 [Eubacterium sp. MSJ-13]|uniref:hypothetical protein n=1 Tax=Eubacterium sp. MSJ-13 TaxID=2841513 RepID=UPI001C0FF687|nr:hypothetical protein [Eubacterium sp. MSJ-13]MBU5478701.1 hypothetical protein [Eubacterium sp. MSJ-13]